MKRFLAVIISVMMVMTMVPSIAFAGSVESCPGDADCNHEAAIGTVHYDTIKEAVTASTPGSTVVLLKDVDNHLDKNAGAIALSLKVGSTLEGNNHTLSGNINVQIPTGGATVQNVNFKDIHNDTPVTDNDMKNYDVPFKVGKLSAIVASRLTGSLTITGCTFDNMDWEAIQITPRTGSSVVITDNEFRHTNPDVWQLRHIHIQGNNSKSCILNKLIVTNNRLYKSKNNDYNTTAIAFSNASDEIPEFNIAMNYAEDELTLLGDTYYPIYYFPLLKSPNGEDGYINHMVYDGGAYYDSLKDALDKSQGETLYLMQDTNESNLVIGKDRTIKINPRRSYFNGKIINNGNLTIVHGINMNATGEVINNGSLTLSGDGAADYKVNNAGKLYITAGGTYDLENKIKGNRTIVISGGTFTTAPDSSLIAEWYVVKPTGDGRYEVIKMNDNEASAKGAVARDRDSKNFYKTITEASKYCEVVYVIKSGFNENIMLNGEYKKPDINLGGNTFSGSLTIADTVTSVGIKGKGEANFEKVIGNELVISYIDTDHINKVTINDGKLNSLFVRAYGEAIINGGEYKEVNVESKYNLKGTIENSRGKLTVKGGLFASDKITLKYKNYKTEDGKEEVVKELAEYIPEGYAKFARADGLFAVGSKENYQKVPHSSGMDTWTWNEETNQYEESRVNPPTPSVPSTPEPEVVPPTVDAEGNIEATVKPDASGKVETTVPSDKIEESLDKVTQSPSTDKPVVEIVVKEEEGAKPADSVDVKVPAEAVDKVAKTEDASLKVTTSVGTVELDNDALDKVVSEAKGEDITITVEKQDVDELTSEAQKETIESFGKEDYVFEVSVRAGGRTIRQLEGEMTFEFDYELKEGELPENVRVYCVDEDGNKQRVEARYDEKTKKLVMKTDYLSIFAVSYVDAPSKVKVLKVKNEKGKAALRWSRATNGPEGYRIYRAKTKDGKYSPIAWVKDGKAKTFKEKAKKTNKTYYYKVRAYKNINGKKVWGEYSPVKKLKF